MSKITLNEYLNSDCDLLNPSPVILMKIYDISNGDPCMDCGCRDSCETRKVLISNAKKRDSRNTTKSSPVETNAEIAKRTGLSKRQVSKMRKQGQRIE